MITRATGVGGASYATQASASDVISNSKELDRNAFLSLLVTQMRNQDPTSPMKNEDLVAQLAQFSSLEQIQQVNSSLRGMSAANYVGKNVLALNPENGVNISGKVSAVLFNNGKPQLIINDSIIDPAWVQRVSA